MIRTLAALALGLLLASCGQAADPNANQRAGGACALVAQSETLFGAGAQGVANNDMAGSSGSCSWASTDGLRTGDLILFSAESLGTTTAVAQVASLTAHWAEAGATGQPVTGFGDEAQISTDLPGGQTQIVMRKGGNVATVVATSGDPALTSEALARQLATLVAAAL